ncbi:hypothetical protein M5K25_025099 [Dendrobium thyrsiflorum]|uniref:Uncharacterized protein n=1 Tax=Dendrobium thyrsiflorum TaxID=117978 RepID=A0ABD0U3E5_DENTH
MFSPPPVPVDTLPPTSNPPSTLPSSLPLPSASPSPSPWSNFARPPASLSRPTRTAKNTYREDEGNDDRCSAGTEDVDYIYPLDSVVEATSSEAHFMEVRDSLHALTDAEMNTNDVEVCGKALGSSIGNVFTAGVKMPCLNSTYKADLTKCSQAARRNITDKFDPNVVGPGEEAVGFVQKKLMYSNNEEYEPSRPLKLVVAEQCQRRPQCGLLERSVSILRSWLFKKFLH